jgi:hypothetical protein
MLLQTPAPELQRPPEGMARGIFPVPDWMVIGVVVLMVAAVIGYFIGRRLYANERARKERVLDSVTPPSSRR